MKKKLLSILLLTIMIVTSSSAVTLAATTYKIHNGEKVDLVVYGGSGKTKWTTNNKNIAFFTKKGKTTSTVKGKKAGTTTITAKRSGAKASCKVQVYSYYEDFPKIPDFGATIGVCPSDTNLNSDDYGIIYYALYKAKNVKTAKNWVSTYEKKLKKKSFVNNPSKAKELKNFWERKVPEGCEYDDDYFVAVDIKRIGKTVSVAYGRSYDLTYQNDWSKLYINYVNHDIWKS